MPAFAQMLSRMAGRTVVDRTGLTGRFDITLSYANPNAVAAGGVSEAPELFTALQEQLGLKLEATRGPVEVLVIDGAQHPVNDNFEMPAPVRAVPPPPPGIQ
jgi:bla regulator protein BlaR1